MYEYAYYIPHSGLSSYTYIYFIYIIQVEELFNGNSMHCVLPINIHFVFGGSALNKRHFCYYTKIISTI